MSTLRTLHEAFAALEERADTAPALDRVVSTPDRVVSTRDRRRGRVLAPVGAAATVAAVLALTMWLREPGPGSATPEPAASRPAAPAATATATRTTAAPPSRTGTYEPPTTEAELTATASAILAGTATIVVTAPDDEPNHRTDTSGGADIAGLLTADGQTGGFQLSVYRSTADRAVCDAGSHCAVRTLPDGTSLAIGSYHDQDVPGGVTYQAEAVRPDGAAILLHLSTERDPKGQSETIASRMPLTVAQMTALVTSDRW